MEFLTPLLFDIYLWKTISNLFAFFLCLPTLELTIFEQEVSSTKTCYANTLSSEENDSKKRKMAALSSAVHIKEKRCVSCMAG